MLCLHIALTVQMHGSFLNFQVLLLIIALGVMSDRFDHSMIFVLGNYGQFRNVATLWCGNCVCNVLVFKRSI